MSTGGTGQSVSTDCIGRLYFLLTSVDATRVDA
jgi:hypothetical protein